jgi:hypothetical protein
LIAQVLQVSNIHWIAVVKFPSESLSDSCPILVLESLDALNTPGNMYNINVSDDSQIGKVIEYFTNVFGIDRKMLMFKKVRMQLMQSGSVDCGIYAILYVFAFLNFCSDANQSHLMDDSCLRILRLSFLLWILEWILH